MNRFRILIIAPFFPYPPTDGGKICIYSFIDYLRTYHEFHLLVPIRTYEELNQLEQLKSKWSDVTFHIVNETPPPKFTSKINKLLPVYGIKQSVDVLKRFKHNLKGKERNQYDFYRNSSNIFPFNPYNVEFVNILEGIFSSFHFDIIQTELTPVLNLVHLIPSTSKKVFVQIESRESVLKDYGESNSIDKTYADYITTSAAFLEYNYMSLYDAVFTLNENDQRTISGKCPSTKVYVSPFGLLADQFGSSAIPTRVQRLIFVGSENHFPNYDGLKWFLTDVVPHLKDRVDLIVTGNWQLSTKKEFKDLYRSILFTGFADDLSHYFSNSISIVPIRLGGGGNEVKGIAFNG